MKKTCLNQFGFSLVELLVVFSIMGIIFGTGYAAYSNFNREQVLVQAKQTLRNNLRVLQSKALTGEKDCSIAPDGCGGATDGCGNDASGEKSLDGWYMIFTGTSYTYYGSCGGATPILFNQTTVTLPTNVTIQTTPSPLTIIFMPLAQGVSGAGTITLQAPGQSDQTINISASGEIN